MLGASLRNSIQNLMADWESEAREQCPAAKEKSRFILQDHLPVFLQNMADVLDARDNGKALHAISESLHGEARALDPDYSLAQVLKEFMILRHTLMKFFKQEQIHEKYQNMAHEMIDQAMLQAGEQFSQVRERQLESTLQRLESTNWDLQQFAAIAAHDLRSPVATISGYVSFMREEIPNPKPDVVQSLDFIASASERLLLLIEKLLDYSRLGQQTLQRVPVDLNRAVRDSMANLEALIEETQAKFEFHDLPTVEGDPTLLMQLFQNLFANSLKFRGSRPPLIRISFVEETDRHWLLEVADNGIGFPASQAEQIFKPFKQLHSKKEYQGSGLGLSTCRRVVEMHGGRIWAESRPGHGSTFSFTLAKPPLSH